MGSPARGHSVTADPFRHLTECRNESGHAAHLAQGVGPDAVAVHGNAEGDVALGLRHRLQDVAVRVLLHQERVALVQQQRQDQLRGAQPA